MTVRHASLQNPERSSTVKSVIPLEKGRKNNLKTGQYAGSATENYGENRQFFQLVELLTI
jgi:hypothetical protein